MKFRKAIAQILVLATIFTLVFCGANITAYADEKTPMSVWLPPYTNGETMDAEFWTETLKPWCEENNVDLSITIVPWENYEERYLTGFVSGQGPDVGYMYNEMLFEYLDKGFIAPMDEYLTDADKDNYTMLQLGQIRGQQYSMPFVPGGYRIVFYNKDILEQAGCEVPTTWDELIDVCLTIKEKCPGVVPFGQDWQGEAIGLLNTSYYPYLWAAGGELFNDDGTCALMDNDAAVKAAQFIYDTVYKYQINVEEPTALDVNAALSRFNDGEIAFVCMSLFKCWDFAPEINWDWIPGFAAEEGGQPVVWTAADGLVLNSASADPELAWSLIHFMTNGEAYDKFNSQMAFCPAITKDGKSYVDAKFDALFDGVPLKGMPVAKNANALMTTLKQNLQLMVLDEMTPEEAIQETVDYFNTLK